MRKKWLLVLVLCLVLVGMQTAVAEDWSRIVSLGGSSGNMGVRLPGSVNAAPDLVPAELIDSLYYPERDNGITRQAEDGPIGSIRTALQRLAAPTFKRSSSCPKVRSALYVRTNRAISIAINLPGLIIPRENPSCS